MGATHEAKSVGGMYWTPAREPSDDAGAKQGEFVTPRESLPLTATASGLCTLVAYPAIIILLLLLLSEHLRCLLSLGHLILASLNLVFCRVHVEPELTACAGTNVLPRLTFLHI
ncbi:hypothetical protein CRG98_035653 [Punica granatum]|uniref:Uncharacterized protein n=1 Tax=Punica granatum TaxID=22663 RepID=A0A2I0IJ00_PUNGR|nr:hypothetical protein CRG98_035653 [Punica granatum]